MNGKSSIEYMTGLSPPARGNPDCTIHSIPASGPIPASAGEPSGTPVMLKSARAYPRQRGGTLPRVSAMQFGQGLSPPARGNHREGGIDARLCGPIPASAGEPLFLVRIGRIFGAYPRQRGGTIISILSASAKSGLSPPARGNLRRIPAVART